MQQFLHILMALSLSSAVLPLCGQYTVVYTPEESLARPAPDVGEIADTLMLQEVLQTWVTAGYEEGYLAAAYRWEVVSEDTIQVSLTTGPQYRWAKIRPGNIPEALLQNAQLWRYLPQDEIVSPSAMATFANRLLQYYENHGYPFAQLALDSIDYTPSDSLQAAWHINKGPYITIDSIVVVGEVNINPAFLYRHLDIFPGDTYHEARIKAISDRINALPFLQASRSPEVLFIRDKALVRLYIKSRNASAFNFLIGILPNSDQRNGGLLVTGEAFLRLQNPFGGGRSVQVAWKNLQPRSPQMEAQLTWPYLLNTSIGANGHFTLFKRDTLWIDIEGRVGLQLALRGEDYLRVFLQRKNSNLISIDTQQILQSGALPNRLDLRYNTLGITYQMERVDYRFSPRRGWRIWAEATGGSRNVQPNSTVLSLQTADFDPQALYDSLGSPAITARLEATIEKYWPIGRQATLLTRLETGYQYADRLWTNELFRVGGIQLLRGFDEESILASWYNVFTAEFRYLLSRNAYFHLFADGGYLERQTAGAPLVTLTPVSVGGGLALETNAGIFEVSYALGRLNDDNPFQWRKGRIHLGYVSYF